MIFTKVIPEKLDPESLKEFKELGQRLFKAVQFYLQSIGYKSISEYKDLYLKDFYEIEFTHTYNLTFKKKEKNYLFRGYKDLKFWQILKLIKRSFLRKYQEINHTLYKNSINNGLIRINLRVLKEHFENEKNSIEDLDLQILSFQNYYDEHDIGIDINMGIYTKILNNLNYFFEVRKRVENQKKSVENQKNKESFPTETDLSKESIVKNDNLAFNYVFVEKETPIINQELQVKSNNSETASIEEESDVDEPGLKEGMIHIELIGNKDLFQSLVEILCTNKKINDVDEFISLFNSPYTLERPKVTFKGTYILLIFFIEFCIYRRILFLNYQHRSKVLSHLFYNSKSHQMKESSLNVKASENGLTNLNEEKLQKFLKMNFKESIYLEIVETEKKLRVLKKS